MLAEQINADQHMEQSPSMAEKPKAGLELSPAFVYAISSPRKQQQQSITREVSLTGRGSYMSHSR